MKSVYLIIIIVAAILASSFLFNKRIETEQHELDVIKNSLAKADNFIKPNSSISFLGEANEVHLFSMTRFILAPAYLMPYNDNSNSDTLLSIQKLYTADSFLLNTLQNRNTIWTANDSLYIYNISTK